MFGFLSFSNYKQRLRDKRKYFEKFSEEYISEQHLLQSKEMSVVHSLITKDEIKFKSNLKFGATYTHVNRLLGKPWVSYQNPNLYKHQILLYKYNIGECKVKCEVHFYQDSFVIGKYISDCISDNRQVLKQYLLEKYMEYIPLSDYTNVKIKDTSNNTILVNDSVHIEFVYMWHLAPVLFINN